MSKQVRTAVFPAGGLGTRFLPATKVIPKEMLPLVDKPIIQYGVEEAIASGIEHIIFITGRGKGAMEDHFDISYELDATLEKKGKKELLEISRKISSMARISYVRQKEPLGLGHAVLCAKQLVGDEPFAVLLADVVDLQAQQVPEAMRKEHARKPKLDGRLSTDREQPCAMQDVAQNAVRSQMDGAIVAARDDFIAQQ